jgi:hypothetical protein
MAAAVFEEGKAGSEAGGAGASEVNGACVDHILLSWSAIGLILMDRVDGTDQKDRHASASERSLGVGCQRLLN